MGASFAYESEPYDLARREEREAAAADSRKRIGPAFKAMSHGDKDFNTCNEFKDGGLAPDDPFRRIKTQTFDKPFMPSGTRQTPVHSSPGYHFLRLSSVSHLGGFWMVSVRAHVREQLLPSRTGSWTH